MSPHLRFRLTHRYGYPLGIILVFAAGYAALVLGFALYALALLRAYLSEGPGALQSGLGTLGLLAAAAFLTVLLHLTCRTVLHLAQRKARAEMAALREQRLRGTAGP